MDGDEPENHVWVGDPYGDGYCCKSKNENQDCCKAADGKWCNNICCNTNQYCENGDCVSDSCTTAETSGSGSFCGGDYLTIARFTAQTSGKIKLIISRDPSQCGTNCHIFGLMDDWAQSTGLGCESSVTKTFSYSAGTHVIQVVVNGDCATGCTSFSYSLTCES